VPVGADQCSVLVAAAHLVKPLNDSVPINTALAWKPTSRADVMGNHLLEIDRGLHFWPKWQTGCRLHKPL
jgi:hypothetical protein